MVVMTRGMFNTLIPVLVIERSKASVLSSQASYSTWRDFGAAVGPLSAPWLFLHVPQTPLYAALAAASGSVPISAWCGARLSKDVLAMPHLGEHRHRIAARHADGALHRRHVGENGLVAFSSPSSDGTVASPRARAASTEAERARRPCCRPRWSRRSGRWTGCIHGRNRPACRRAGRAGGRASVQNCCGVPSNIRPQPSANKVSPQNSALCSRKA